MRYLVCILLIIFVMYSCKKKNQPENPIVNILLPVENQDIYLPNAVDFEFNVESDKSINSINVEIVNKHLIPLTEAIIFTVNSNSYTGISQLVFDTLGLNTQTLVPPYYFKIRVETADNSYLYYREVLLIPESHDYQGFALISQHTYSSLLVKVYDKEDQAVGQIEIQGGYKDSEISYAGELFITTGFENTTYSISMEEMYIKWEASGQLPYPGIAKLKLADNIIYQSENIGRIIGINKNTGTVKLTTPILKDTVPDMIGISDNYILTSYNLRNGNGTGWYSFYKPSGYRYSRYQANVETKAIFTENDVAVIFSNTDEGGQIIEFDIGANEIISSTILQNISFELVCKVVGDQFVFSNNNVLYEFDMNTGMSSKTFSSEKPIIDIKYDETSSTIFLLHSNSLTIINRQGTIIGNKYFDNDLIAIELIY